MYVDRVGDIPGVAAGHCEGYRDLSSPAHSEDHTITPGQPGFGHTQPTERVALIWISTGQVDHELGFRSLQRALEALPKRPEEGFIGGAVLKGDVQIALFLVKGEVAGAVDREGEDLGVASRKRRGSSGQRRDSAFS